MADASTIAEFFVSLGFKLDETSAKRFTGSVKNTQTQVEALQAKLATTSKAVGELGKGFTAAGGEPTRKYEEASRKVTVQQEMLRKSTVELGRSAVLTGTAFGAAIVEVSKDYERLYYTAQQAGTSAENLSKLQFGMTQIGLAGGQAGAMITQMNLAMKSSPGLESYLRGLTGVNFEAIAKGTGTATDKTKEFLALLDRLATMAPAIRKQVAELFGIPQAALEQMINNLPQLHKGFEEYSRLLGIAGVNQDKLATSSKDLMNATRTVTSEFALVWDQALQKVQPVLTPLIIAFGKFFEDILAFNQEHPAAALAEAFTGLAAGAAAADAAFALLLGKTPVLLRLLPLLAGPFGVIAAAVAAGVYEIIQHWDTLGPYFAKKGKELEDAFGRRDWAAIGKIIGDAILDGLEQVLNLTRWLAGLDWEKAGETIGKLLGTAISAIFGTQISAAGLPDKLLAVFGQIGAAAVKIGVGLVEGIAKGMYESIPGLKRAVDGIMEVLNLPQRAHEYLFGKSATPPARPPGVPADLGARLTGVWPFAGPAAPAAPAAPAPGAAAAPLPPALLRPTGAATPFGGPDRPDILQAERAFRYQGGGIVPATGPGQLHAEEMVLPAPISRGLQALIRAGNQAGAEARGAVSGVASEGRRAFDRLHDWLSGQGEPPKVVIDNTDDLAAEQTRAMAKLTGRTPGEQRTYEIQHPLAAGIQHAGAAVGRVIGSAVGAATGKPGAAEAGAEAGAKAGAKIGGAVGGAAEFVTGKASELGSLLARGESGGNYNVFNQGTATGRPGHADFSQMTVGDLMQRQALPHGDPNRIFAFGKYQVIPETMKGAVAALHLDPNTKVTPELQEKIFSEYLIGKKRPEVGAYISGKSADLGAAQRGLAREWASVADPQTGRSDYGGVGGNRASISAAETAAVLQRERARYAAGPPTAVAAAAAPAGAGRTLSPQTNLPPWERASLGGDTNVQQGDKTVTMHVTNNVNVSGHGATDTLGRYADAHKRLQGDLVRATKNQMA